MFYAQLHISITVLITIVLLPNCVNAQEVPLIQEMIEKHFMFQNSTCPQSGILLLNSKMFENATCAESVYLLQKSEMFENEIKIIKNLSGIIKGVCNV